MGEGTQIFMIVKIFYDLFSDKDLSSHLRIKKPPKNFGGWLVFLRLILKRFIYSSVVPFLLFYFFDDPLPYCLVRLVENRRNLWMSRDLH